MKSSLYSLLGIAIFITAWQILSLILEQSLILPTPLLTFQIFIKLLSSQEIILATFHTAWKVFLSLFLVLLLGIPIGFVLGLSKKLHAIFSPIITIIQAVPVISWLALVIFAWGIGWKGPVLIAVLSLIPMAIITTISGMHNLDNKLLEVARVYRVSPWRKWKDIYLGSLFPFIIAIINVNIGHAWKVILVAEYLVGDTGLGVQISWARQYIDVPKIYAITLLAIILGLLSERLIKYALRRVSKKWAVL